MTIRFKLISACLALLLLNASLGYFARAQQQKMGDRAMNIYDGAYMGLSYITQVQTALTRFGVTHASETATAVDDASKAELTAIGAKLNVAVDRAMSLAARTAGTALAARLTALPQIADPARFAAGLTDIDRDLTALVKKYGADGLTARDDVEQAVEDGDQLVVTVSSGIMAVSLLIAVILGWSVLPPLRRAVTVASAIADGKLDSDIKARGRSETATLMRALARMQTAIAENLRGIEARHAAEAEQRAMFESALGSSLRAMATTVETETTAALSQVGESTAHMRDHAGEMEGSAARTDRSARDAALAANEALSTAQTVASAAEQLSASIGAIRDQVARSTEIVGHAVSASDSTRVAIQDLGHQTEQIGAVADLIREIAARTNLLALNATIEAARAGAAGKGFAVVAAEVKQLANQTARSTEDIARHLAAVRAATENSIRAVGDITGTIAKVDSIALSIAHAIEQQGEATMEIARNVAQTAAAVQTMNSRIADVSAEATRTGGLANDVRGHADALAGAVGELKLTVVRVVRTSTTEVNRRSWPRFPATLPCRLTIGSRAPLACELSDLSLGGAKIEGADGLVPGEHGELLIEETGMRLAVVIARAADGSAGVKFVDPAAAEAPLTPLIASLAGDIAA